MTVLVPGDGLLELVRSASGTVVIVAPYIKSPTMRKLIAALPDAVSELACVTRWLPEDIAAGVCDLEIYEDVTARTGRLLVHPHLHAKYYRAAARCLVGSANVTARALGWVTPGNLELLVELPAEFPGLALWERTLLGSAILATPELRDRLKEQADRLKQAGAVAHVPDADDAAGQATPASLWIPICPVPERLWIVYRGGAADTMVSSAREAAQKDLMALAPPQGLSQQLFEAYVGGILRQMPLMSEIDQLASRGLNDSQAHEFLTARLADEMKSSVEQTWRGLKAWLIHFFPQTYRLETGQEVLFKGRELPR